MAHHAQSNKELLPKESIIIDAHCDSLGRVLDGQRRLGEKSQLGQFDFPRAIDGGLTASLMATFVSTNRPGTGAKQTLRFIDIFYQEIETFPTLSMFVKTYKDIIRAKETGKVGLLLSMEGAEGLEGDLRLLRTYYKLGLRVLGITWNLRNEAADGTDEIRTGGGLSRFGVQLVKECNRLGVIIDIAHLSPIGVKEVLEISDAPVIASHANSKQLCDHPRNLDDTQLEAIAKKGGVVGVTPVPPFLNANEKTSTLSDLLNHIDHMVSVIGEDYVGLGMDFDGVGDMRTIEIEDVSKLPQISIGLAKRGYTEKAIKKILGGNYLRLFKNYL
jgi:membrane dipeptidase